MLESTWKKEADTDRLKDSDRLSQLAGFIGPLIIVIYLVLLWTGDTGFYTSEFSGLDAVVLFVPIIVGMAPSLIRLIGGRKNLSRPFDVLGTMLFVLSAVYFLCNFHFDMAYFPEPLPGSLRFLVDWLDEGWARLILLVGIFGGAIGVFWTALTYFSVKELLARGK